MEKVPADLNNALIGAPKSKAKWEDLTAIGRRDFVSWITSTKQLETRKRRIERMLNMLVSGKRRPCCYAVVPMNLYKVLGENLKAKVMWKELTPDERRDFTDWIEEAKDSDTRAIRITKVCTTLAVGKKKVNM